MGLPTAEQNPASSQKKSISKKIYSKTHFFYFFYLIHLRWVNFANLFYSASFFVFCFVFFCTSFYTFFLPYPASLVFLYYPIAFFCIAFFCIAFFCRRQYKRRCRSLPKVRKKNSVAVWIHFSKV